MLCLIKFQLDSVLYYIFEIFAEQDKACEDIDMAEVGPVSLDSKKSQEAKLEKLREEAQYEKERVRHLGIQSAFLYLYE